MKAEQAMTGVPVPDALTSDALMTGFSMTDAAMPDVAIKDMPMTDHSISPALAELLQFWFGVPVAAAALTDPAIAARQAGLWWRKNPAVDAEIRQRFEPLLQAEQRGEHAAWQSPRALLARIILLDQLSRNMYRGQAAAFANDDAARALARQLLASEADQMLSPIERVFAYLPFEHAEHWAEQQQSVALFAALCRQAPPEWQEACQGFLDFAEQHCVIVERFGRFPHRNVLLGRPSTAEEQAFLQQPGSSF